MFDEARIIRLSKVFTVMLHNNALFRFRVFRFTGGSSEGFTGGFLVFSGVNRALLCKRALQAARSVQVYRGLYRAHSQNYRALFQIFRALLGAPLAAACVGLEIGVVEYFDSVFDKNRVEQAWVVDVVCAQRVVEGA